MRVAIDAEGILMAFGGENTNLEDILRPSIIAVTDKIIDDYNNKIFRDGSGLSKDWLTRIYSSPNRLRLISEDEQEHYNFRSNDIDESYVCAAFFNGHHLISPKKGEAFMGKAKAYGIQVNDISENFNIETLPGHSVIFNALLNSQTHYNHSIIRHFFSNERRVVIYDRYIKNSSICLFENVLRFCHPTVEIILISDFDRFGNSTISADLAKKSLLKVRPQAKINCYYPDLDKLDDKHDRHIHLGSRLQMTFSSGTDCFGLHPEWRNSECDIYVHYLSTNSPDRHYAVLPKPNSRAGLNIKVHSKI